MLLLALTVWFAAWQGVPLAELTRDGSAVAGAAFWTGALSNIGILLWCATASACLLTAGVLRATSEKAATRRFVFFAGLFTTVLMLDDLFLFHETIAPRHLGLPENIVLLAYGLLAVALLAFHRRLIARSAYGILGIGLTCFAGSILIDRLHRVGLMPRMGFVSPQDLSFLLEDGFKLLGIAGWFGYYGWVCYTSLTASRRAAPEGSPPARR